MSVTTLNNVTVETKDTEAGKDFLASFRKAAKAGTITDEMIRGAVAVYGDPVAETGAMVEAAAKVAEGRALIVDGEALAKAHRDNAAKWLTVATLASDGGVSARRFASVTGTNPNTLGRLVRAAALLEAARANKSPMTLTEAITYANQHNASEVTALVVAYGEAEEGATPGADNVSAIPAPVKVKTAETYVKALDNLADLLSDVIDGGGKASKAETQEALARQDETLARIVKQHAVLTAMVRKASRTPGRKSA